MKRFHKNLLLALNFLAFTLFSNPAEASDRLRIFVSIPPQKYLLEQIGKDKVDVSLMVQPGASPHTYEPRPRQMVAVAKTDLYFTIGVEFESVWLDKLASINPKMKIVQMQRGIKKIPMTARHGHDHDTREKHEDDHDDDDGKHQEYKDDAHQNQAEHRNNGHNTGLDPHIWLSPPLVKQQVKTVLDALQKADPSNSATYESNYQRLIHKITELDRELAELFRHRKQTQFLVFHPSWGYFAHAYRLKQVAIEVEGKSPKPAQLQQIIERMREDGIRVIFVQPQFSSRAAKLIARSIGGKVVFVDPLAENWMANMRNVAEKFRQALP